MHLLKSVEPLRVLLCGEEWLPNSNVRQNRAWCGADALQRRTGYSRKEVIQPQLPLQLPCYDFVPVTSPALDACLLAVGCAASGVTSSHDVTGGVYKARERIHRTLLTRGY